MTKKIFAKKSLGQNFLKSKKAIQQMIEAVSLKKGDMVIEIGPGKGALTGPILESGAQLIAFELDERMIAYLEEKFASAIESKQLIIVHRDILEVDINSFVKNKEYKIIANIPYYITNAIVRKFLEEEHQPSHMSLLMQKEVAERIVRRDGKESILALSVALFASAKYLATVHRRYFSPAPKVDSAILHIFNISHDALVNRKEEKKFFLLIRTAFAHKRKRVIKNLEQLAPKKFWEEIFEKLSLSQNVRAEEISLENWLRIFDFFIKNDNLKVN